MRRDACPPEAELSRALPASADPALSEHLLGCAGCRNIAQELARAVRLARALPAHVPSLDRREQVRAALLATASSVPVRASGRLRQMGLLAGAAAVIGVLVWLGQNKREDAGQRFHATLRPAPGARYAVVTPPPQETVHVWDGTVAFDVDPLLPHERLRVEVGDGEVEVRGTVFTVTAKADRLVQVDVTRGRVDVRPVGAAAAVLQGGGTWRAAPVAEAALPAIASPTTASPLPTVGRSPRPGPEPVPPAPARWRAMAAERSAVAPPRAQPTMPEAFYDDAWDALRAGDFAKAAGDFARVSRGAPAGPLADEAAFWRATALARGGDSPEAIVTFSDFLARFPRSLRRGEASAMLGWLLVDAGRANEAARHFRVAVDDSQQTVRASAREGLKAISQ